MGLALRLIAAAALALSAAACLPETDTLLSDRGGVATDRGLLGAWYSGGGESETAYLNIVDIDGTSMMVVYSAVEPTMDDAVNWRRYEAHGAELDGDTYLNLILSEPQDAPMARRMVARYALVDGRLKVELMDPEIVTAAVREGRLPGRVESTEYDTWPVIEADRGALIAFIREVGADELFSVTLGPFDHLAYNGR